jgi:hypothetical protein
MTEGPAVRVLGAGSIESAELAGRRVPPLVTQITDGENGGVMMNEFPKVSGGHEGVLGVAHPRRERHRYLDALAGRGISCEDLPPLQPRLQHRV